MKKIKPLKRRGPLAWFRRVFKIGLRPFQSIDEVHLLHPSFIHAGHTGKEKDKEAEWPKTNPYLHHKEEGETDATV